MKPNKFYLVLSVNIIAYLVISAFFIQKGMFNGGEQDGFYKQILFIANGGGFSSSPLYPVHLARFVVVYPFYFIYSNQYGSIFESIVILLFLIPVIVEKFGYKQRHLLQILFVYLPFFFSFRSVLVMCSMAYLFICLYGAQKSDVKLLLSMFLANLSSGVLLPWALIVILNVTSLSKVYKYLWFVVIIIGVAIAFSILQKIGFFFEGGESIVKRNTFYVSIYNGQYARVALYSLMTFAWLNITFAKMGCEAFTNKLYSFYFPIIVTLFFEGLGLISFLIPVLWFFMGIRPRLLVKYRRLELRREYCDG